MLWPRGMWLRRGWIQEYAHGYREFSKPGDDLAYLEWLEAQPLGYVLNTGRGGVRYTRLHLVSCRSLLDAYGRRDHLHQRAVDQLLLAFSGRTRRMVHAE